MEAERTRRRKGRDMSRETTTTDETALKTGDRPPLLKTWKIRASARGVELTINGQTFELGDTRHALLHDLDMAVHGWPHERQG